MHTTFPLIETELTQYQSNMNLAVTIGAICGQHGEDLWPTEKNGVS